MRARPGLLSDQKLVTACCCALAASSTWWVTSHCHTAAAAAQLPGVCPRSTCIPCDTLNVHSNYEQGNVSLQAAVQAAAVGGDPDAMAPTMQLTVGSGVAAGTTVTAVGTVLDPATGTLQVQLSNDASHLSVAQHPLTLPLWGMEVTFATAVRFCL